MADEEQLAMLRESVDTWNLWRTENPDAFIDLSKADLYGNLAFKSELDGADLHRANLRGADLSGADLIAANLNEADLLEANLCRADLSRADLSRADLSRADLSEADLSRTHLRETILHDTDLSYADLCETDLRTAKLGGANLTGADLTGADLTGADLTGADVSGASLRGRNLSGAKLFSANLSETDLRDTNLDRADLHGANLSRNDLRNASMIRADLRGANLSGAALGFVDLSYADLSGADLSGADLTHASCIGTRLQGAILTNCRVYGVSAWSLELDDTTIQTNLCITPFHEPVIMVDSLEVAQFLYLMLHNQKIRQVIDTIAKKLVLILGRFTPERKQVLNALRDELRRRDYLPVVFDFEKPSSRDLTETVSTLAHMARFVIADLTEARSIPQELSVIVPNLPSVAVQPLIQEGDTEYAMFERWQRYPWVLNTYRYQNVDGVLSNLKACVIDPAEQRANELKPPQKSDSQI